MTLAWRAGLWRLRAQGVRSGVLRAMVVESIPPAATVPSCEWRLLDGAAGWADPFPVRDPFRACLSLAAIGGVRRP